MKSKYEYGFLIYDGRYGKYRLDDEGESTFVSNHKYRNLDYYMSLMDVLNYVGSTGIKIVMQMNTSSLDEDEIKFLVEYQLPEGEI